MGMDIRHPSIMAMDTVTLLMPALPMGITLGLSITAVLTAVMAMVMVMMSIRRGLRSATIKRRSITFTITEMKSSIFLLSNNDKF